MPATFNARAETVAEKPMFRSAFNTGMGGLMAR
jgi:putative SOS response-associated peptidase YedK